MSDAYEREQYVQVLPAELLRSPWTAQADVNLPLLTRHATERILTDLTTQAEQCAPQLPLLESFRPPLSNDRHPRQCGGSRNHQPYGTSDCCQLGWSRVAGGYGREQ